MFNVTETDKDRREQYRRRAQGTGAMNPTIRRVLSSLDRYNDSVGEAAAFTTPPTRRACGFAIIFAKRTKKISPLHFFQFELPPFASVLASKCPK